MKKAQIAFGKRLNFIQWFKVNQSSCGDWHEHQWNAKKDRKTKMCSIKAIPWHSQKVSTKTQLHLNEMSHALFTMSIQYQIRTVYGISLIYIKHSEFGEMLYVVAIFQYYFHSQIRLTWMKPMWVNRICHKRLNRIANMIHSLYSQCIARFNSSH